jgi:hypothetical protein
MKTDFPNYVNFYSSFINPTKTELKEFLERNGWKIRLESWNDFEVTNSWAELNLLGEETSALLKGTIINPKINYKKMIALFESIDAKFQAELYNEDESILFQDKTFQ